jgi:hypothetical protein
MNAKGRSVMVRKLRPAQKIASGIFRSYLGTIAEMLCQRSLTPVVLGSIGGSKFVADVLCEISDLGFQGFPGDALALGALDKAVDQFVDVLRSAQHAVLLGRVNAIFEPEVYVFARRRWHVMSPWRKPYPA